MITRYVGIAAIVMGVALTACATTNLPTPMALPTATTTPQQLIDFTFSAPVQVGADFATFIGPGIWEIVPHGGRTYEGTVEYLVEALDANNNVILSYNGEFKRKEPDIAKDKPTLSELIIILIANEGQVKNPVPDEFAGNPLYMIPSTAAAVRVTVDPANKINKSYESNNVFVLRLPPSYSQIQI